MTAVIFIAFRHLFAELDHSYRMQKYKKYPNKANIFDYFFTFRLLRYKDSLYIWILYNGWKNAYINEGMNPANLQCQDYTLKKIWKNLYKGVAPLLFWTYILTDYQWIKCGATPSKGLHLSCCGDLLCYLLIFSKLYVQN